MNTTFHLQWMIHIFRVCLQHFIEKPVYVVSVLRQEIPGQHSTITQRLSAQPIGFLRTLVNKGKEACPGKNSLKRWEEEPRAVKGFLVPLLLIIIILVELLLLILLLYYYITNIILCILQYILLWYSVYIILDSRRLEYGTPSKRRIDIVQNLSEDYILHPFPIYNPIHHYIYHVTGDTDW